MSYVQSGGLYKRGAAPRFDPKNSDGHYVLDLAQPWDNFIAESLYSRMADEAGEAWINKTIDGAPLEMPDDASWAIPQKGARGGSPSARTIPRHRTHASRAPLLARTAPVHVAGVLEFDYVTWKRGLEATFILDLANPCDLFIAGELLRRTSRASDASDASEALRVCMLNDQPFDPTMELPPKGTLQLVYTSTKQQDELVFELPLNLEVPTDKIMCLRLWERALTTPTDAWRSAVLGGSTVTLSTWQYPEVPSVGTLALKYAVRLATKPHDRGVYFSAPMQAAAFRLLRDTLSSESLSEFDRTNLIKQTAARNYLTSHQVKALLELVSHRKGKLEVAVMLHPRTIDPQNFVNVLQSLPSEADRLTILDMVDNSSRRRRRQG